MHFEFNSPRSKTCGLSFPSSLVSPSSPLFLRTRPLSFALCPSLRFRSVRPLHPLALLALACRHIRAYARAFALSDFPFFCLHPSPLSTWHSAICGWRLHLSRLIHWWSLNTSAIFIPNTLFIRHLSSSGWSVKAKNEKCLTRTNARVGAMPAVGVVAFSKKCLRSLPHHCKGRMNRKRWRGEINIVVLEKKWKFESLKVGYYKKIDYFCTRRLTLRYQLTKAIQEGLGSALPCIEEVVEELSRIIDTTTK